MTQKGNEFVIPNSSKKLDNIQILEAGPNPGILYSIVDEGTHYNKYFDKSSHTVRLIFEFPLLKQLFNEGDTEERPTVVSQEYTFVLAENSNLKKFIDGAEGRVVQPNEYRSGWNLGQYLGRTFIIDIINKPNKKDPSIIHNNIGSVKALTDTLRQRYNFDWDNVTRTNPLLSFMIDDEGKCFQTEDFTKLPNYLQKKLKESDEGIKFRNNGGVFAERSDFANVSGSEDKAPVKRTPKGPEEPIKRMLVDDYTYEEYIASGWTDDKLVKAGKLEIIQPKKKVAPPPTEKVAPPPISDDLDTMGDDVDDVPF